MNTWLRPRQALLADSRKPARSQANVGLHEAHDLTSERTVTRRAGTRKQRLSRRHVVDNVTSYVDLRAAQQIRYT